MEEAGRIRLYVKPGIEYIIHPGHGGTAGTAGTGLGPAPGRDQSKAPTASDHS